MLYLALAFAIASVIAQSRARSWPLELFSHFRPHLIAVGAVGLAALLYLAEFAAAGIVISATLANLATFPKLRFQRVASQPGAGLCVLWANLWKRERALEQTLAYARAEGAEILLFAEFPAVDGEWLSAHASDYPHVLLSGPTDALFSSRVAILSKLPFEHAQTSNAGPFAHRPMQTVRVRCGDAVLSIVAVHPQAPGAPQMTRDRDIAIGAAFKALAAPALIAGDFNATPWCPVLADAPTRIGDPLRQSTWLTRWPFVGLPIDHMFVTDDVIASHYSVGPLLGSDHRALVARVHVSSLAA